MTDKERIADLADALHIAQTDRDKWKERAQILAKKLGIRDCDIDLISTCEHEKMERDNR